MGEFISRLNSSNVQSVSYFLAHFIVLPLISVDESRAPGLQEILRRYKEVKEFFNNYLYVVFYVVICALFFCLFHHAFLFNSHWKTKNKMQQVFAFCFRYRMLVCYCKLVSLLCLTICSYWEHLLKSYLLWDQMPCFIWPLLSQISIFRNQIWWGFFNLCLLIFIRFYLFMSLCL